jgi:hypothetical protein
MYTKLTLLLLLLHAYRNAGKVGPGIRLDHLWQEDELIMYFARAGSTNSKLTAGMPSWGNKPLVLSLSQSTHRKK